MDSTLSMAAPKQITRMDFRCLHRGHEQGAGELSTDLGH